jgi:chromosome segregation ATPase
MPDAGTATAEPAATLEAFIERTTEALASLGADEETLSRVDAAGDELVKMVASQQNRLDELEHQVKTLESELQQERETRAKADAEDRKRIHKVETQVEEASDDSTTNSSTDPDGESDTESTDPGVEPPEVPLEEVIRVPEHLVEEHLTANQRRARFVAKDVAEYTRSVPAGRAIRSSQLRQVLRAGEDGQIYTETVSRVIRFLDDLGGDAVTVNESRRGERVVVFTEAFVERVQASQHAAQPNHTVVTGHGVGG